MQIAVQVATYLLGRGHRGIHVEALHLRKLVGHHRFLDVAGNAQLALHALLGCGDLGQALGCTMADHGEDDEEDGEGDDGHNESQHTGSGQTYLLFGYLALLALSVVDGGQLCGSVLLLTGECGVEAFHDLHAGGDGRVLASGQRVGFHLRQEILADIVERQLVVALAEHQVQGAIVVGGLGIAACRHQIVAGVDTRQVEGRKVGLAVLSVAACGLLFQS